MKNYNRLLTGSYIPIPSVKQTSIDKSFILKDWAELCPSRKRRISYHFWTLTSSYNYIATYMKEFQLLTDHKPLTSIIIESKSIELSALVVARLQRWAIMLSTYQYDIEFQPTHNIAMLIVHLGYHWVVSCRCRFIVHMELFQCRDWPIKTANKTRSSLSKGIKLYTKWLDIVHRTTIRDRNWSRVSDVGNQSDYA